MNIIFIIAYTLSHVLYILVMIISCWLTHAYFTKHNNSKCKVIFHWVSAFTSLNCFDLKYFASGQNIIVIMCAHGLSYVNKLAPLLLSFTKYTRPKNLFLVTTLKSERLCAFFSIRMTSKWVDNPICFTNTHHYKAMWYVGSMRIMYCIAHICVLCYLVSDTFGNIGKINSRLHKTVLVTPFDRPHLIHLFLRFSVHILSIYIVLLPNLI